MRIKIVEDMIVVYGQTNHHPAHAHYALQMILPEDEVEINGVIYKKPVLINSQVQHVVKAPESCESILVDPNTTIGRHLIECIHNQEIGLYHQVCDVKSLLELKNQPLAKLDDRIEDIFQYIEEQPKVNFSVDALASYVNLSTTRLSHLFKQEVGISVIRYLMWRKLIHGAKDIFLNHLTITEGAYKYGFSDDAHFSRLFKKTFGLNLKKLLLENIE